MAAVDAGGLALTMQLCCPLCGSWSVCFSSAELWTGPDGKPRELVHGTCSRCTSTVLVEPSVRAVELASARLSAAGAMRKMAPVSPAEGTMADGPG